MTQAERQQLEHAAKTNAPLRKLLEDNDKRMRLLQKFVELAPGVFSADPNDRVGDVLVHYSDGTIMQLQEAFERLVHEVAQ